MVVNFCNIFQPYAEPEHIKLKPVKTLFLFVTQEFIFKNFSNSGKNIDFICHNLNDESVIELFKPFINKKYDEWLKDFHSKYTEDEIKLLNESYPDFFQMDNVYYQICLSNRQKNINTTNIKSQSTFSDKEVKSILEEEKLFIQNNLVINKNIDINGLGMTVSHKYMITSPMLNNDFEIFPIKRSHWNTVWAFHLPCVRGFYNGDDVLMLPSFISSLLTYMNLDWRYVAGKKDICDIINKYRFRMFGTYLNKKEISMYLNYNSRILFWNNLYGINMSNKNTYKNCLGTRGINEKLYKIRLFNMESFFKAPPINLDNAYNDSVLSLKYKEVTTYQDFMNYMYQRFNCINISEVDLLNKYKTIDPKTGYVLPLKKDIIETIYELYSDQLSRLYELAGSGGRI
jgi:hypothetical protein